MHALTGVFDTVWRVSVSALVYAPFFVACVLLPFEIHVVVLLPFEIHVFLLFSLVVLEMRNAK